MSMNSASVRSFLASSSCCRDWGWVGWDGPAVDVEGVAAETNVCVPSGWGVKLAGGVETVKETCCDDELAIVVGGGRRCWLR
jgi:hypothetical protein